MAWFIAHSLITIILAALLGLLVGWLWWGRQWSSAASKQRAAGRLDVPRAAEDPAAKPSVESPAAVATSSEPDGGALDAAPPIAQADVPIEDAQPADDLQRIEGIGPRIASALHDAEIRTFEDLAAADPEQLSLALRAAGLSFAPSASTWPDQAAMLLDGDEAGLTALKHRLVPERDHATAGGTPAEGIAADDLEPDADGTTDETPADETPADAALSDAELGEEEPGDSPVEIADRSATTEAPSTPEIPFEDPVAEDTDDDLERIEGVGPRIAAALHAADLNSYLNIAAAEPATLQAALEAAGLRFAPSLPTWPRQAILLADGDTEGHARLTASLGSGSDADRKK